MPLSSGTKAIGPAWASATTKGVDATDDRIDPDDSSLTPPIVLADGYPASFSAVGGNTPRRKVVNELFYRVDSGILDIRNYGILPWDTDVDTLEGGVKQVIGVVYRALEDNGPTYSNAVSPTAGGQTVWEQLSGTLNIPNAPAAPTAVAGNGTLDWSWASPKDNGAAVTSFDFQWREAGQGGFATVPGLTNARYLLAGLTNGTVIEAKVQANNSQGASGYGAEGMGTPVASVPGGGNTLALRADTGDASGEIDLDWLAPDTGGDTITQYRLQWRESGQSFTTGRQANLSGAVTGTTRSSLTDGTEYFFRIRARNSIGNGPWSNEASATPVSPIVPPSDTAPDAPAAINGTPRIPLIVDWTWELPDDNGGQVISSYDFQWRYDGNNWSNANLTIGLEVSYYRVTITNTSNGIQARARARNSVGVSAWRTSGVIAASSLFDSPQQRHRFTSSQTWNWPYGDLERASIFLYGTGDSERLTSHDINFGSGVINCSVSDGHTIFVVVGNTARAYDVGTRLRDTNRDITLPSSTGWEGGASNGQTIWFMNDATNQAYGYNAFTYTADTTKDFAFTHQLDSSGEDSAVYANGTIWIIAEVQQRAYAYDSFTLVQDTARDIVLSGTGGTDFEAALSDGSTLWFVDNGSNRAFAFSAFSQLADPDRNIQIETGTYQSAFSDGNTLWFIDNFRGEAYTLYGRAQLRVNGVGYDTQPIANGIRTAQITGIDPNESFSFTFTGDSFAEVYPQV